MDIETIARFRVIFEKERENLIYSNRIMNEEFHLKSDDLADDSDKTSSEMEQSMRLRLRNREALYIKKIDAALSRMDEGKFGLCDGCGGDIEMRRLQARPTTTLCVECKELEERREKNFAASRRHASLGVRAKLQIA